LVALQLTLPIGPKLTGIRDLSAIKKTLHQRAMSIEFPAEAFNAFNHD
jgi:hypothetical protein